MVRRLDGGVAMKALSWYKVPASIRRVIGFLILFMLAYLTFTFLIKFIFYILYVGTVWIDKFFKLLVS